MRKAMETVLVVGLALGFLAPISASAKMVKEKESGVEFPALRKWGKYNMACVGAGLREKWGFDVYAACLYIDKALGKKSLTEFLKSSKAGGAYAGGKLDKKKLFTNQAFFSWLIKFARICPSPLTSLLSGM